MPRQRKTLWEQSDNQERLKRAVRNFNAKIKRIENKDPEMKKVLPEKVTLKEMKNLIKTRQDLNREIKSLQRFTEKGAEELVDAPNNKNNQKITKWQRKEMSIKQGVINRRRKQRLKDMEEYNLERKGKDLGYTSVDIGMGKQDEVQLKPINAFTPGMDIYSLRKKFKTLRKESQSQYWNESDMRLKQNYLDQIEENFGSTLEAQLLVARIDAMDFKKFYKTYRKDPNKFEHFYFPNEQARSQAFEDLKSVWGM